MVDDLDQAEREAAKAAAEIGRDRLPRGEARLVIVEVRDEQRRPVIAVTVTLQVERVAAVA
jgi:uncharacterized protein DUF6894